MESLLPGVTAKDLVLKRTQRALLACGVVSSLLYIVINMVVPAYYPGYSITSQTVSELSAIGAPSRLLWVALCFFYSLLVTCFGWGIFLASGMFPKLRKVSILVLLYGFTGFFWPPMHQREVLAAGGGTLTDTMHIVFTFVTVLLMMLIIISGMIALKRTFRIYSITTLATLIVFGILTGIDSPGVSKNLPTPLIGIWERINIGVYMLWIIIFAIALLRKKELLTAPSK